MNAQSFRLTFFVLILAAVGGAAFAAGVFWSSQARGDERPEGAQTEVQAEIVPTGARTFEKVEKAQRDLAAEKAEPKAPRVVYPAKTDLDFEGMQIQGQIRSPGEFYFQHREEEKFDSLVKRRKNFHREILRDVVLSK